MAGTQPRFSASPSIAKSRQLGFITALPPALKFSAANENFWRNGVFPTPSLQRAPKQRTERLCQPSSPRCAGCLWHSRAPDGFLRDKCVKNQHRGSVLQVSKVTWMAVEHRTHSVPSKAGTARCYTLPRTPHVPCPRGKASC